MLFSRDDVASFVNQNFEPVWESVRPVPMVRIDFGNGTVLTRTLNGNIATHVCNADGEVLDILPGIYAPATYLDRLNQFRLLANYVEQKGKDQRAVRYREYHRAMAEALKQKAPPPRLVNMANLSKVAIEGGLKAMLVPGRKTDQADKEARAALARAEQPRFDSAEDVANWKALAEDTLVNEMIHRQHVHAWLAAQGLVRPESVTRWLYREVLHADLDDPYLGLGKVLFATYPFREERSQ